MQKERDVKEEKHYRKTKSSKPIEGKREKKQKSSVCEVERRRAESTVKSARCEGQEADDGERVKRPSEGSEERLLTDKRADTWPQSAGRW